MKRLLLTSSFKDVAQTLEKIEPNLSGKRVTFIPTASKVEKVIFYVESGKKALESLGLIVDVLDISTATSEEIKSTIENNEFIYVTGGNTFYLLQELKRTKSDELIIKEVLNGKLYIGESAGSVITAPNIEYLKYMDSVKKAPDLKTFDALDIVNFSILPHYTNFPFKKQAEKIASIYDDSLKLIKISNNQAVFVKDEDYEVLTV